MKRTRRFSVDAKLARYSAPALALLVFTACQAEADEPSVTYLGGPPLGTWTSSATEGGQGGASGEPAPGGFSGAQAGTGTVPSGGAGGLSGASGAVAGQGGGAGMGQTGGTAGGDAGAGGGAAAVAIGVSSLAFEVLTHSQGGKYSPKNIGAIWIETREGDFVKTLEVWAQRRAGHLTRWKNETGSSRVDAVSSATLRSHTTHRVSWDLSDTAGNSVGPGAYKLVVEATDRDSTGASQEVPFTLDGAALAITPPDVAAFSDMSLTIE